MEIFFMIFLAIIAILSLFVMESTFGKLFWFLFCGFISLSIYTRTISPIGFIDDSLTEIGHLFGKTYKNPLLKTNKNYAVNSVENENYDTTVDFDRILISSDISNQIDSSKIVQLYQFDENTIKDIKRILSDNNPDPENKNGTICGQTERKCKWCSNLFYVDNRYLSIYNDLKRHLLPDNIIDIYGASMYAVCNNNEVKARILIDCNLYRNGERYCSILDDGEFCSEKCQTEYKLYQ